MKINPIDKLLYSNPAPESKSERKIQGAYGRTYRNEQEVLVDWRAGKDFKFVGGPYFSIRDRNSLNIYVDVLVVVDNTGKRIAEIDLND